METETFEMGNSAEKVIRRLAREEAQKVLTELMEPPWPMTHEQVQEERRHYAKRNFISVEMLTEWLGEQLENANIAGYIELTQTPRADRLRGQATAFRAVKDFINKEK